jgi:cation diffusion facilitator family transporter
MTRLQQTLPITILGMAVNTLLAIGKLIAGNIGHSQALIADGVESLADIVSSFVVWRGLVVAAEPADEDHPYGHGKAESIAAATVAALLLVAAGTLVVQSSSGILTPQQGPRPFTLVVLVAVVCVKEAMFRLTERQARRADSAAVHSDAWHHRSDAITSLAAAVGISIALVGGPGFERADSIAALVAAAIIALNGWKLLRPALNELMDRSPDINLNHEIEAVASSVEGVDAVEKCLVRKMGHRYFVDLHLEVDPEMSVRRSHEIAHQVKDQVKDRLPSVRDVLVHIEPSRSERED